MSDEGRYPSKGKGKVPPEDWVVERVFDSADYLDRKPPKYEGEEKAGARARQVTEGLLSGLRGRQRRDRRGRYADVPGAGDDSARWMAGLPPLHVGGVETAKLRELARTSGENEFYASHSAGRYTDPDWWIVRAPEGGLDAELASLRQVHRRILHYRDGTVTDKTAG